MDVACVAFYFLFIFWLAISNLAATLNTEAKFKEKLGVWDPMLKLTQTSSYPRVNSIE
jgi:hypothetical protein